MGFVSGSGYSQVPLLPESALATLVTTAAKEIKAKRSRREDPIMRVGEETQIMLANVRESWSQTIMI